MTYTELFEFVMMLTGVITFVYMVTKDHNDKK
jgi:hypothetical protein